MAGPWEKYQQQQGPWTKYASPESTATPPAQQTGNSGFFGPIQDAYDEYTAPTKGDSAVGNAFANFGRGVMEAAQPLMHPIKTAEAMQPKSFGDGALNAVLGPASMLRPMISGAVQDVKQNGLASAIPHIAGQFGGGLMLGGGVAEAPEALDAAGGGIRRGAYGLNNAVIGTTAEDMEHGANPGRALAKGRVVGSNPATLAAGVKKLIPGAAADNRAIIAAAPANKYINVGPLVSEPFDSILKDVTDEKTGVATPSAIKRANATRTQLTHVIDDATGKPTDALRNPFLSPIDATRFKSSIYDMTDYDNPSKAALANKGLKGAAHNLKAAVEQAVPDSIESGQYLHDLMAAKDVLDPRARLVKLPTSRSGLIDRMATYAGTGTASAGDALGANLQGLARYINAKPLVVPAPILAATAGSRRN